MNHSNLTGVTAGPAETKILTHGILDDTFFFYAINIICVGIDGAIAFFGIIFNIINIMVFWRQGFAEVVNISLFALAITDLGVVTLSFQICAVYYNIWINNFVSHINFHHAMVLLAAYPKSMFARVGSFLTAFICFERCLCVLLPLKVKSILTRKVSVTFIFVVSVPVVTTYTIPYICMWLAPQHIDLLNKTVVSLYFRDGEKSQKMHKKFGLVMSFYQLVAFTLVVIFTSVLVFTIHGKNEWRKKTVTADQMETMATKDNKVIKMVVIICITFIICYTPAAVQFIAEFVFPKYGFIGPYHRMHAFIWAFGSFGDITCSTINIFFYYRLSSKYAAILDKMIGWNQSKFETPSKRSPK